MKKGAPSQVVVKPGDALRLRYAVWIHAGDADQDPDCEAAYADYLNLCNAED